MKFFIFLFFIISRLFTQDVSLFISGWNVDEENGSWLDIYMENSEPVYGFQLNIDTSGLIGDVSELSFGSVFGGRAEDAGFALASNGSGLILCFSLEGNTIPNGVGVLTSVHWNADELMVYGPLYLEVVNVPGDGGVPLSWVVPNIPIVMNPIYGCLDPDANNYNPEADFDSGSCEYFQQGDLNQDNQLNVLDIVRMVNIIMGDIPSEYELWAGDMNEDEIIDVLDIVIIVNCIITDCWSVSTVTDFDGNVYNTVIIGDQEWMAENLKVTHYRNGDEIPNITNNSEWSSLSTGAYGIYNNDPTNTEVYGNLYNWYAVDDTRGVCPEGFHAPSDEEWMELEMTLGMSYEEAITEGYRGTDEGSQLAGNVDLWDSGALESNSEFGASGFLALPGGSRYDYNGYSYSMGNYCYFWSSTAISSGSAWCRFVGYNGSGVGRYSAYLRVGFSVRCIGD